jgi:plasmid stability protein
MASILIRDIDEALDKALKIRAAQHGCTREAEIKAILQAAVGQIPRKRPLAEALMDIPQLDADIEDLFARSQSPARQVD